MAALSFTVAEARNILWANGLLPKSIKDVRPDNDGLRITIAGGIAIQVRPESFAQGVLKLAIGSSSWAFKMADALGKVDELIDEAIRDFPFIRRENKSLFIDLDEALQGRVRGMRVRDFKLQDGLIKIEF